MTHLAKIISMSVANAGAINVAEYVFSPDGGKLILKGENGSGKSTVQDVMKLSTGGATIVNRDYDNEKLLINAFIADGDNRVAVTIKNGKNGMYYSLKGYDSEKKPIGEIGGVSLTAGAYLKMLYDPIITKVDDFCSQDKTRARNCHTELFADKLGKIAIAELVKDLKEAQDDMQYNERLRNTVADGVRGTDEFLKSKGIDWKRPDTHPAVNFEPLESTKIELLAEQSRLKSAPKQDRLDKMNALESEMKLIAEEVKNYNSGIEAKEKEKETAETKFATDRISDLNVFQAIENSLLHLRDDRKALSDESFKNVYSTLKEETQPFFDAEFKADPIPSKIQYDESKRIDITKRKGVDKIEVERLDNLQAKRDAYISLANFDINNPEAEIKTPEVDKKLADLELKITIQSEQKGLRKALDAFFTWQDSRDKVTELKAKIAEKYAAIDTGIEGLEFKYDDESNKTDMYYDGSGFDFFKKLHGNSQRVTAMSETERALLCLMVQFKRMSERSKSINLTYIDCSLTNKSYECVEQALEKYGLKDVYVVASQACDVTVQQLDNCDILVEGGQIFFNGQYRSETVEADTTPKKGENGVIETKY